MMTLGLERFEYYLKQLDALLIAACKTDNPALYLYKNDARTKVFMLEGLAKLYAGMHNEKAFLKIKERLKALEDLLGAIDYYDSFVKDFLADIEMPKLLRIFLEKRRDENITALNALLLKRKWINHDPLRTNKIRKKLATLDWQKPEDEVVLIRKFYEKSIKSTSKFYAETGKKFTNIEEQVHELRRRLRWLSIYPQALQGAIQFSEKVKADKILAKYLTPEIVKSPFNKLPAKGKNTSILKLEKNYFLALSYTIAALGKLKDKGLRIVATKEAVQSTLKVTDSIAQRRAFELNDMEDDGLINIMQAAKDICEPFFKEQNLQKLLA
jgi:hypothetical protein